MRTCEELFDRQSGYSRDQRKSFDYCYTLKKGGVANIQEQAKRRVEQELQRREEQIQLREVQQQQV